MRKKNKKGKEDDVQMHKVKMSHHFFVVDKNSVFKIYDCK